jgi:hypothetical protein
VFFDYLRACSARLYFVPGSIILMLSMSEKYELSSPFSPPPILVSTHFLGSIRKRDQWPR